MLSIAAISSIGYYDNLSQEDYYRDGGNSPTRWLGGGATHLGLEGPVQSADFQAVFAGFAPNGAPLLQNAGSEKRRPGWDLTFSAPKSVSVLWGIADDSLRAEIERCHEQAVLSALEFVERHAGWSRKGKAGRIWEKARLIFATFRHGTSRALDPNLHTHCLAANLVVCEDGRTRALHSRPLYAWKMASGAIYRVALAFALQKNLGLLVKHVKDSFELEGVPKSTCREFSQRSQQIRANMERHGWSSARAAEVAALETRQPKAEQPTHLLHAAWREVSSRLGLSPEKAGKLFGQPLRPSRSEADVGNVIKGVIERLHQSQSHFTKREVLRDVAYQVMAWGISSEALVASVERHLHRSHDIVHLAEIAGDQHYATRQVPSETVRKLLHDLDSTPLDALKHHARQLARAAKGLPTYRRRPIRLDDKTVLLLDEVGMIGTVELHRFIKHAQDAGAKVVLVGDPQQLSPIDAGGPFRALLRRYPSVRLERIERQSDPRDIEAIHNLSRGEVRGALRNFEERGLIHVAKDRRRATERLVNDWTERGGVQDPASHAILVATNADRVFLNAKCQAARYEAKQLDPDSYVTIRRREKFEGRQSYVAREDLHVGDRVMFLERSRLLQVENGDLGVVTGYDRESRTLSVRLDADGSRPRTVVIPIAKYQALTLGYAATTHKFQGATVPHAYALLGGGMQSLELTFTQLSRAKHSTRLYADELDAGENLEGLVAQIERSHAKVLAHDLLESPTLSLAKTPDIGWKAPDDDRSLQHSDIYPTHEL